MVLRCFDSKGEGSLVYKLFFIIIEQSALIPAQMLHLNESASDVTTCIISLIW